jgi:hypothetical protein
MRYVGQVRECTADIGTLEVRQLRKLLLAV